MKKLVYVIVLIVIGVYVVVKVNELSNTRYVGGIPVTLDKESQQILNEYQRELDKEIQKIQKEMSDQVNQNIHNSYKNQSYTPDPIVPDNVKNLDIKSTSSVLEDILNNY